MMLEPPPRPLAHAEGADAAPAPSSAPAGHGAGGWPGETVERAARLAARLLDVPLVLLALPGGPDAGVRVVLARDEDGPAAALPVLRGLCRHVADLGQPLWLQDLSTAPAGTGGGDASAASFAGVPVRTADGGGALCVADGRERAWSPDEQRALADLAELLGSRAAASEAGGGATAAASAGPASTDPASTDAESIDPASTDSTINAAASARPASTDSPSNAAASADLGSTAAAAADPSTDAAASGAAAAEGDGDDSLREIADGFAAVIEASPLPIVAIDREGRIELWSPAAERMFGWTQDEVLRKPSPIVPESERESFLALRERALRGERMTGVEVRRVRKDGSSIDVTFSTAPLTRGGEVYGSIIILDDITQRRKAEDRLRFLESAGRELGGQFEYEDRLESLARLAVPALGDLCVIDLLREDGTVTRAQAVHADESRQALLAAPDGPAPDGPFARVMEGEPLLAAEATNDALALLARGAPGDDVRRLEVASLLSVPLRARGRTLGVLTLASTQRAHRYGADDLSLAQELASRAALLLDNSRLYGQARQSTRAREEVLAVVSHELRNPLQAIVVLVDTLLQSLPPEAWRDRERRQLESVLHVSRQMSRLVQDLLDVTRIESGHFSVRPDRETLGGIVDEALQVLRPLAERENVRLEVRVPDRGAAVFADRQRIIQSLGNLVDNAIRATGAGGVVTLAAEAAGGPVTVRVSDTGPGVPAEHLPHLFHRFWRPERTGGLGAGLGLAIARGIVEAHGGAIGVDTGPRGSTFWFTLPNAGAGDDDGGAEDAYDSVVLLPGREPARETTPERRAPEAATDAAASERHARFREGVGHDGASGDADLVDRLRDQIANALHLGHIHPGDRLPSIRDLSRRFGVTTYAAVHAYEALASEGLVEKRGRSGMYVAEQDALGRGLLGETALWLTEVMAGAWEHQIKVPHVPDLVRRWTAAVRLGAACVESDEDTRAALCAEASSHFGMDSRAVHPDELEGAGGRDPAEALRGADVLITTAYHASAVRRVADALGKPVLVAGVNPEHTRAIEDRLRDGELTVVCADPRFGERVRAMRGGRYAGRVRVVLADDAAAVARLDPSDPVLMTRAAHERLEGAELRPLVPLSPFISSACARALTELLVRRNVEARRV